MDSNRQLLLYVAAMLFTAGSGFFTVYAVNGYQWKPALVGAAAVFCAQGIGALARMGVILNAFSQQASSPTTK